MALNKDFKVKNSLCVSETLNVAQSACINDLKITSTGGVSATGLSALVTRNGFVSAGRDLSDVFARLSDNVDGSGTAHKVPVWTDSNTLGDSPLSTNGNNVSITGNLSVLGDFTRMDTIVTTTSALSIINHGTGPALFARQAGASQPIAEFVDKEGGQIIFDDGGLVGLGTSAPGQRLTVAGNISSNGALSASGPGYNYFESRVGINTPTPDYMLDVAGSVGIGACLIHNGDDDTFIYFTDDDINFTAGGVNFIDLTQDTASEITFNEGGADVDFRVEGTTDNGLLYTDAGTDKVGIGTRAPSEKLTVAGSISANGAVTAETVNVSSTTNGFVSAGRDLSDVFTTCVGDITQVVAGEGLTGGGDSGSVTLNVSAGDGVQATANCVTVDGTVARCNAANTFVSNISVLGGLSASNACIGGDLTVGGGGDIFLTEDQRIYFEADDQTWIEADSADRLRFVAGAKQMLLLDQGTGDRAVFGFGTKVGINVGNNTTPTEELTVSGNISANGTVTAETVSVSSTTNGFVSAGRDLADIFNTTDADITEVVAGTGLTGGGDSGSVTLNVSAGDGVDATANCITVDSTVVRTTGAQSIGGAKTLTDDLTISSSLSSNETVTSETVHVSSTTNGFISAGRDLSDVFTTCVGDITQVVAGTGLTGGGDSGSVTVNVSAGDGVQASANCVSVDSTVVRTTGAQSIAGAKCFSDDTCVCADLDVTGNISTTDNSKVISTRKLTARDGNGILITEDGGTTGLSINDSGAASFGADVTVVGNISANGAVTSETVHVSSTTNGFISAGRDLSDIFATASGNVDGSGTANVLPVWSDTDTLTDSIARQSTGHLTVGGNISATGSLSAGGDGYNYFAGRVGIGTDAPDYRLDVAGNIGMNEYLYHNGDGDTYLRFGPNEVNLAAGGKSAIKYVASDSKIILNNTNVDVDVHIMGDDGSEILATDAANNRVGINTTTPAEALTVAGNISAQGGLSAHSAFLSGSVNLPDTAKLQFGNGNDLQIYHDGSDSIINDSGTGNLEVHATNLVFRNHDDSAQYASFINGGAASLYHNNSLKFATGGAGVYVQGSLSATEGLSASNACIAGNVNLPDDGKLILGDGGDLELSHNGSTSFIKDAGTGNLEIWGDGALQVKSGDGTELKALFDTNGSVDLYYNNSKKFETTNTGANIIGELSANGTVTAETVSVSSATNGFISAGRDLSDIFGGCISEVVAGTGLTGGGSSGSVTVNVSAGDGVQATANCVSVDSTVVRTTGAQSIAGAKCFSDDTCFCSDTITTGNATIQGNLSVTGEFTRMDTIVDVTSAMEIQNHGTGPALTVNQAGVNEVVDFQDDGASVFKIINGGNVGIGEAAPGQKLTVAGNVSAHGSLSATGAGYNYFNGRVGIGTATPASLLHVNSDSSESLLRIESDNGNGDPFLHFKLDSGSDYSIGIDDDDSNTFKISRNATLGTNDIIKVDSTTAIVYCNLLVGEADGTLDGSRLEVWTTNSQSPFSITNTDNSNRKVLDSAFNSNNPRFNIYDASATEVIRLETSGDSFFNGGNVGIGTSAPVDKLTVAGNISAQGGLSAHSAFLSGSVNLPDDAKIQLGNGNDLEIYHDGSHSYISDTGTGNLNINASNLALNNGGATKTYLLGTDGGSVQLRYNDSTKIETTNTGANIIGELSANGTVTSETVHVSSTTNGFISAGRDLADIFGGCVTGSGTSCYIAQWHGSDTINNAPGYFDSNELRIVSLSASAGICTAGIRSVGNNLTVAGSISAIEGLSASNACIGGALGVDQYICHNGDADTFINFTDDDINIQAGGVNFIDITQDTTNEITFNEAGADINFRVEGDSDTSLLFTDAGNDRVGIGTSAPGQKLTVAGNISAHGALSATGAGDNYFAGNVGIGTADPPQELSVKGEITTLNSSGIQVVTMQRSSDHGQLLINQSGGVNRVCLNSNGDSYFNGGSVGIGTTAPSQKLTVGGGVSAIGLSAMAANQGFVSAGRDLADIFSTGAGTVDGSGTAHKIPVWSDSNTLDDSPLSTNGYNILLPVDDACIGVGASNDLRIFHNGTNTNIENTTGNLNITNYADDKDITLQSDNGYGGVVSYLTVDGSEENLLLTPGLPASAGLVGIGTTSPSAKLHVNDDRSSGAGGLLVTGGGGGGHIACFARDVGATSNDICIASPNSDPLIRYRCGTKCWATGVDSSADSFIIAEGADVGHSTGTAVYTVDPSGNTCVKGNLSAYGQGYNYLLSSLAIGTESNGLSGLDSSLLQLGYYDGGSNGGQSVFGNANIFTNSGDDSLFLGLKDGSYPNRGWAFQVNSNGVNADLAIKEHGSTGERMRIATTGNVGIGTSVPCQKLSVAGTISAGGDICVYDDLIVGSGGGDGSVTVCGGSAKIHLCDTTDTDDMFITFDNGGASYGCIGFLGNADFDICASNRDISLLPGTANVGIGETAPGQKLTVAGNISAHGSLSATGAGTNYFVGNVGIGIANPGYALTIDNGDLLVCTDNGGYFQVDESANAVKHSDNVKAMFGTGNDLQIYHDGNNWIDANGVGDLYLRNLNSSGDVVVQAGSSGDAYIKVNSGETALKATNNGATELYYDDSKKLETTNVGVTVTGTISSQGYCSDDTRNTCIGGDALEDLSTGCCNTAVGYCAAHSITSGCRNIAVGYEALKNGLTATDNIAIGMNAGCKLNTSQNIMIGYEAGKVTTGGCCNNMIGYRAGFCNVSGKNNTFIGNCAGCGNVYGHHNIAIGTFTKSGTDSDYGDSNVIIGDSAATCLNTDFNVLVGTQAGRYLSGGQGNHMLNVGVGTCVLRGAVTDGKGSVGGCNVAVGEKAMMANTTGVYNTAVGCGAMTTNTTGCCNVSLGRNNMLYNTTGDQNTSVGTGALQANTTGNENVAVGARSMIGNTIGCSNVAIGNCSLTTNVTGTDLVAIGYQALCKNNCSSFETAIGYQALKVSLTARDNTAVGFKAGCLIEGCANTAIGSCTLRQNTTGCYNTGVGRAVLYDNTTGYYNAVLGADAAANNTTGLGNAVVGGLAFGNNQTGNYNSVMGLNTLCNNTDGHCNVAVGYGAGRYQAGEGSNVTSADNSTYVGARTQGSGASPTNETVIGFCACGCGDNTISIGNGDSTYAYFGGDIFLKDSQKYIAGTGADFALYHNGSYTYLENSSCELVINQVATDKDVKILGSSVHGNQKEYIHIDSSEGALLLTTGVAASAGKVGIGTTSPAAKLDVYAAPNTNSLFLRDSSDNDYTHNFYVDSSGNGHTIMYAEGNSAQLQLNTAGDNYFCCQVGIGTSSLCSEAKLTVNGSATISGNLSVLGDFTRMDTIIDVTSAMEIQNHGTGPALTVNQAGTNTVVDFQDDGASVFKIVDGGQSYFGRGISAMNGLSAQGGTAPIHFGEDDHGIDVKFFGDTANCYMVWDASQNRLEMQDGVRLVMGSSADSSIRHQSDVLTIENATGDFILRNTADNGDIKIQNDDGYGNCVNYIALDGGEEKILLGTGLPITAGEVGIGHPDPTFKLHVSAASTTDGIVLERGGVKQFCADGDGRVDWGQNLAYGQLTWDTGKAKILSKGANALSLGAGGGSDYLYISGGTGNVGIGLTDPDQKLDVNGNIRIPNEGKIAFGSAGTSPSDYLELNDVASSGSLLKLVQDSSTKFVVQGSTGNVGMGTDDPDIFAKLTVAGGISAHGALSATSGMPNYFVGNIGIGTNTPDGALNLVDSCQIRLGTGGDFRFYHNGTNNCIEGHNGDIVIYNYDHGNDIAFCAESTSGTAAQYIRIDTSAARTLFSTPTRHTDGVQAGFGTSDDFTICHNGTDITLDNDTGEFYILNRQDNKSIIMQTDDGYGNIVDYIVANGNDETILLGTGLPASAGEVGIGTSAPGQKLTVSGNISAHGSLSATGAGYNYFASRVGIGTAAHPAYSLDIHTDDDLIADFKSSDNHGYLRVRDNSDSYFIGSIGGTGYIGGQNSLNNCNLNIDLSNGNVGIAETAPGQKLTISGNISAHGNLSATGTGYNYFASRVGIGTTTPSNALHLADNCKLIIGTGSDLQFYHDGSNSTIYDQGTGDLVIATNAFRLKSANQSEDMITAFEDGAVNLMYNNTTVFNTRSTGVCVVGGLSASGHIQACSKAFVIDHPTKPGKKLKHGSVEAPEWSVHYRGKTDKDQICLPSYWEGLVREDSVTAMLTPMGEHQNLYVISQDNNHVCVGGVTGCYNYIVYGERKDIDKMEVEIDG